jgi:hypothetical protein
MEYMNQKKQWPAGDPKEIRKTTLAIDEALYCRVKVCSIGLGIRLTDAINGALRLWLRKLDEDGEMDRIQNEFGRYIGGDIKAPKLPDPDLSRKTRVQKK